MGLRWKIAVGLTAYQLVSSGCHHAEIDLSDLLAEAGQNGSSDAAAGAVASGNEAGHTSEAGGKSGEGGGQTSEAGQTSAAGGNSGKTDAQTGEGGVSGDDLVGSAGG